MTEQRAELFNTLLERATFMWRVGQHGQFLEATLGIGRLLEEDPVAARRLANQTLVAIEIHSRYPSLPIGESIQGSQLLTMLDDPAYPEDLRNLIRQELDLGHQR